jgi:2-polyprenyl-3-methyl-5-hydroxy-6-metoxy-1,4-benzoquinol methylase
MKQEKCPVCGFIGQRDKPNLSIQECLNCGVTWTLIKEGIDAKALYEDEVYAVVDNRKSIFEKIIFKESKKVIRTVNQIFKEKRPIKCLDFGSGKGQFLLKAKEAGWEVSGIETALERAKFSREKYGIEVSSEFYDSGKIGTGNFDVICLFHVLEHLPHPLRLLKEITENNLKKGGVLIIEIPNLRSWQHKIAGNNWMHLDIPKHLTHWDEDLLTKKTEALGFEKIKSQYFSVHLGVLGSLSAILFKLGYKGNIIYDLKNKRKTGILIGTAMVLPISFILEVLAVLFRKTGIIRLYFKKHEL